MSAAQNPDLVELMAKAHYERGVRPGSGLPPWERCLPHWKDAERDQIRGAVHAAEAAGFRIEKR